jgi:hypothetical protein
MKRILRREKSGYALGLLLFSAGLVTMLISLWRAWPEVSSAQNPALAIWTVLWTQSINVVADVEVRLLYIFASGMAMLVLGLILWALSRQWFALAGNRVVLQCPFCQRKWRTRPDKALVHCPFCRQLVHPRLVEN